MNGFETILPFLKPIEHLIVDDSISEVMVNGGDCVFFEKNGFLERAHGISIGERALLVAVKNIARRLGNDISEASPILDSRLPDGSRVAAVIPPCSLRAIAREFDGDQAATDAARVLRLPGFLNKKYEQDFLVSAQRHSDRIYHAREFKLRAEPIDSGYRQLRRSPVQPNRSEPRPISQSERDWAYVKSS